MKKKTSLRMFIFVMITMVIVVLATTRRESYNPWLPWNWFRKPEPTRPRPRPRPTPERKTEPSTPGPEEVPRSRKSSSIQVPEDNMNVDPRELLDLPRPRPGCHPLSLDPRCKMDPRELFIPDRPAQPISPGVRARMQPR